MSKHVNFVELDYRTSTRDDRSPLVPSENWRNPFKVGCKRAMDIFGSALLLILLSPMLAALALAVEFSSPGGVLYRWRVVGENGRFLVAYKFRSMVADADQRRAQLEALNEMRGPVFKITEDPRLTGVGRWMRKYSLDELPQLYSVLKGDMSLVGPRPPLQSEYLKFDEYQKQKLLVRPGITCVWQVSGRNQISDFNEWVSMDLQYIRDWSLALDVKLLAKTAGEVFRGSGK